MVFAIVLAAASAAQADASVPIKTSIEALADPDPEARKAAADAMGQIGPAAVLAVPALIEAALADPDQDVRRNAADALGRIGPPGVTALADALADPDREVRRSAANALGSIGPAAALAVPALIGASADLDREVRRSAANALGSIGPAAVSILADALANPDREVRRSAAFALRLIGPAAAPAVPALIEALADPDQDARRSAAEVLGRIGPAAAPAVPAIIEALADPDREVRRSAADALERIGSAAAPALPALIGALADPDRDVRRSVAAALGEIGPSAAPAVPGLVEALVDPDRDVRRSVLYTLGQIGPSAAPAVPALIEALRDPDRDLRWNAAEALGSVGPSAAPAVPALIEALADQHEEVRQSAAVALGQIGPAAAPAVPALTDSLADPNARRSAAFALGQIATSLRDEATVASLGALQEALEVLETHTDLEIEEDTAAVRRAVEYLELLGWQKVREGVAHWIYAHPLYAFIIGAVLIWFISCLGFLWLYPAAILMINDVLHPFNVKLPDWSGLGGITVPLRHLLLVGALNHQPRVLDAWVSRHVGKARENFERKRTVEERSVHIPVPVNLDKETVPELKGQHLRGVFGAGTGRLLIWGEGGSGKTSIACQIARWAMAEAPEQRPAPHRMLPVLIERELDFEVKEDKDPFTETVRGDFEALIDEPVGEDLLAALLKRRRVLVIIDHLSEMTEETRRRVRPDVPNFPAAALIVTSRLEERLGDVPKCSLRPLRVSGKYLSEFMSAYLNARGVRELFLDPDFFDAGARIAELVGERDVTVLLVKLYLDRLIETKHRDGDLDKEMPESIPSLMLHYLNDINRAVPDGVRHDERKVHRDAKAVAWACLEERFRPGLASIDRSAIPKLAAVEAENEMERLAYLEKRLRLIETAEPEQEQVRFLLDPVAEYLAGLHLVRIHGKDKTAWKCVLERLDAAGGGLEATRGFILALRDCCLYRPGEVPDSLGDELAKRGGLDLEKLREARRRERIARYTRQLMASDADDRPIAAEMLGRLGPSASEAVPALVRALEDEDSMVRSAAAVALGQIGSGASEAVVALAKALQDAELGVRLAAAEALELIGPAAEAAVPALVKSLQDEGLNVRRTAALALGKIGPAAEAAIPALADELEDQDVSVAAAIALGDIGLAAVPALVKVLKGGSARARWSAAGGLAQIGPAAEAAIPALREALHDADANVRDRAALALRNIGGAEISVSETVPDS